MATSKSIVTGSTLSIGRPLKNSAWVVCFFEGDERILMVACNRSVNCADLEKNIEKDLLIHSVLCSLVVSVNWNRCCSLSRYGPVDVICVSSSTLRGSSKTVFFNLVGILCVRVRCHCFAIVVGHFDATVAIFWQQCQDTDPSFNIRYIKWIKPYSRL